MISKWMFVLLAIPGLIELGVLGLGGMCRPACTADEVCNLGTCQQLTNCECAVDHKNTPQCDYDKKTGDDPTACGNAGCCWLTKKKKCYHKNTRERVKECSRLVPHSNRADYGWPRISPNDCFCVGGCFDSSIVDTYWCFQPAKPLPVLPVPVGGVCTDEDTCEDISTCESGICTCPSTHFAGGSSKHKCLPLIDLGKSCKTGDVCKDASASCSGNTCKCNPGYYEKGGKCVGKIAVGGFCTPTDQCADTNAVCEGGICKCVPGYFKKNDQCVAKIALEKSCGAGDVCKDGAAECSGGKCSCKADYHNKNGVCVGTIPTGKACDAHDHCADAHAGCKGGVCTCNQAYYQEDDDCAPKIPLGKQCPSGKGCADGAAECKNGLCQCKPDYHNKGGICVGYIKLTGGCSAGDHCADKAASCQAGTCLCNKGYFEKQQTCTPEVDLGHKCDAGDKCKDDHASCSSGSCACKANFHNKDGVCVGTIPLEKSCDPEDQCADPHAECLGLCKCKKRFFNKNGVCEKNKDLGESCDIGDTCKDDLAICDGTSCKCGPNYYNDNGYCVGYIPLNEECGAGEQCADSNAECTANGLCKCKNGFFDKADICVEKVDLKASCDKYDVCKDADASCTGAICDCNPGFHVKDGKCVGDVPLDKKCDKKDFCADPNAVCNSGYCKCKKAYFDKAKVCVPKIDLGGACDAGDVCKDSKATCTNKACRCPANHFISSTGCAEVVNNLCPAGMTYKKEFNICYKKVTDKKTWEDAQTACEALHPRAHLVEIFSQAKQQFVSTLMAGLDMWYGGQRVAGGGVKEFEWSYSKRPFAYTNWNRGQPDKKSYAPTANPNCPMGYSDNKRWHDRGCGANFAFLCEVYIESTGVGLFGQCLIGDIVYPCATENAECSNRVCNCKSGFIAERGHCVTDNTGLCPAGMIHKKEFKSCYKKVTDGKKWSEAQEYCESIDPNSHLVEVRNQAKQDYVELVMAGLDTWYGGRRPSGGKKYDFRWTHSKTDVKSYTNWHGTQPDHKGDGPAGPRDCMIGYERNYQWYDTSCNKVIPFLCEKDISGSSSLIPLTGACTDTDVCGPAHSACIGVTCQCVSGYTQKHGACVLTGTGVCPSTMTYHKEFDACYKAITEERSWLDAQAQCASLDPDSHLIEVTSKEKQAYVVSVMGSKTVWLGGQRVSGGGSKQFQWTYSETPISGYTKWGPSQPDGKTIGTDPAADCMVGVNSGLAWYDRSCGTVAAILCEKYASAGSKNPADLGEHCGVNEYCATANSVCLNAVCKCGPGFTEQNNLCVPQVELGGECTIDADCKDPVAICDNTKCLCPSTHEEKNKECVKTVTHTTDCNAGNLDVLFLIDNSGSINDVEMNQQKAFVKSVAGAFRVADDETRVGIIKFGTRSKLVNPLNSENNLAAVLKAVDTLAPCPNDQCDVGGWTNTAAGLNLMSSTFRNANKKNNKRIGILMTDGPSNKGDFDAAIAEIPTDAQMFAVGVDGADHSQLLKITGNPEHILQAGKFNQLRRVIALLTEKVCGKPDPQVLTCSEKNLDLVFIIDNSGSIDSMEMSRQRAFISQLADSFDISNDDTRIGFIKFGTKAVVMNNLNSDNTDQDVDADIRSLATCPKDNCETGGWTNTGAGLDAMTDMFKSASNSGKEKVAVLFTDGPSNKGDLPGAIRRIASDVTVFGVGVDGADQSELKKIARSDDRVFKSDKFIELSHVVDEIRSAICGKPTELDCPQGMTVNEQFQICYVKVTEKKTWTAALQHCNSLDSRSHLVEVPTPAKQKFVHAVMAGSDVWYGGKRLPKGGAHDFQWQYSKTPFTYKNWRGGQPDMATSPPAGPADCLMGMSWDGHLWRDRGCSYLAGFLCERSTGTKDSVPLGGNCGPNDICSTANSVCLNGVCTCGSDFTESAHQCVEICKEANLDLVFISDNSGSINQAEMNEQQDFLYKVAESFTIGDDDTRVGFIKFGTRAVVMNRLDSRNTGPDVNEDIARLEICPHDNCETGAWTNTASGLNAMTDLFQSSSKTGHKKAAILVTDGESNKGDLATAIGKIPGDVTMFVVGVDGAVQSEMLSIAGSNSRVFKATKFSNLMNIVGDLRSSVCGTPTVQVCKDEKLDVVLVSDNSGSIDAAEMAQQKHFLSEVAESFTIGSGDTRVGLIKFGTRAKVLNHLDLGNTYAEVDEKIQSLEPCPNDNCETGGWTNTASGLDAMTTMFTSSRNLGHRKVAIFLTDGESNRGNLRAAIGRIPSDVTVFAVGVDGAVESELQGIARSNDRVLQVKDFDQLSEVVNNLRESVCT